MGVDHVPRRLPEDRRPDEPDAVRHAEAGARPPVGVVVDAEVRGVRRVADTAARRALPEEVVPDGAPRRAGVPGAHGEHVAVPVAPALAHLLGVAEARHGARPPDEADRDPVPVLVHDDVGVERAVHVRVGVRADVHLHPRARAVRGRHEVGVVAAGVELVADVGAALHLGVYGIARGPAAAVVVGLEVPRRLGEAVAVEHVVDDVGEVEKLRGGGVGVGRGVLREVQREGERERGAAVRRGVGGVGRLVVVAVHVGVGVVAARGGELGARGPVGVVPAVGRGERVLHAGDERAAVGGGRRGGVDRRGDRERVHLVARGLRGDERARPHEAAAPLASGGARGDRREAHGRGLARGLRRGAVRPERVVDHQVVPHELLARGRVHADEPEVVGGPRRELDLPREAEPLLGRPGVDQLRGHLQPGDGPERRLLLSAAPGLGHRQRGRPRAHERRHARDGGLWREREPFEGGGRAGGEIARRVDHLAAGVHGHAHDPVRHVHPADPLLEVHIGEPRARVAVGAGEREVGHVARGHAHRGRLGAEVG